MLYQFNVGFFHAIFSQKHVLSWFYLKTKYIISDLVEEA